MERLVIPQAHRPILVRIVELLRRREVAGWLVGGYVRDLLLGKPGNDLDLAVDGPALALARELADQTGGAYVTLDDATETARVVWKAYEAAAQPLVVDVVRLRAATIEADLRQRDLTINAVALRLDLYDGAGEFPTAALLDPTGGESDLLARMIRPCGSDALAVDPLRMLRAVRIAAQLDFMLAPETTAAIREQAARIKGVARERVRDELLKLLARPHAAPWLKTADDLGLLMQILPELEPARGCTQPPEHFLPVLAHLYETVAAWEWLYAQWSIAGSTQRATPEHALPVALRVLPDLPATLAQAPQIVERMHAEIGSGHRRYALFKLATLLHDIGKPATRNVREDGRITFYGHEEVGAEIVGAIGQRLRLGREPTAYLKLIVAEHMRPGHLRSLGPDLTKRAVYRLLRDTGAAAPDVLVHALCDHMAVRGPMLSQTYWEHHLAWTSAVLELKDGERRVAQTERLLSGSDLIGELGIVPGPLIGRVLAAVQEAHFLGEVRTRQEALALAAKIVQADQQML